MLFMSVEWVKCDENVVDVRGAIDKAAQHVIHNSLKSLGCVAKSKTYDWKFKEAERRSDSGLVYISCCDGHLEVGSK